MNPNAAGIDCGSDEFRRAGIAVPEDRDPQPVRRFGAFTADLIALAAWLQACRVDTVAIESTGVYWIPLYEILEAHGIDVKVVDPRRLAQVPGRKTDVLDCQWIQQLHSFGLLAGAFRPVDEIVVLRSYMRQRETLVRYAGQHTQHMQKALEQMNLKLTEVLSDITGAIPARRESSTRSWPANVTRRSWPRCATSVATTTPRRSPWRWRGTGDRNPGAPGFALKQAVDLFRTYHVKLGELDEQIESHLKTFADKSGGVPLEPRTGKKRSPHANQPRFDVRQYVVQLTGVDLTTLDGFKSGYAALDLISEIGTDMSAWPTEKHFASWLGLCPGIKKTGGRRLSGRRPKKAVRAANILRLAAYPLLHAHCALGAFARRLRAKLGAPKAITATAHKLARIVYRMLKYGKAYSDVGVEYYERRYPGAPGLLKSLQRRASEMGFELLSTATGEILTPSSPAAR